MKNRREFLKTATATIGALGLASTLSQASEKDASPPKHEGDIATEPGSRIDVHHHIIPVGYVDALAANGVTGSMGLRFPDWSVQKDLELMDRLGIQTAVTSLTGPAANVPDPKEARRIARLCNDFAAKMISDHPKRYGAFVTVPPLTDMEGVLGEIVYGLDTLKFDGVCLMTNYQLKYLGDSAFDEIYKELNRRKVVVHIHPDNPPCVQLSMPGGLMDVPFDTTRTATNLICSGTMERYPDITFILAHGGGTLPYLSFRIGEGVPFMWKGFRENAPKGFYAYLNWFYFDTAIVGPAIFPFLHKQVGSGRLLVGTDFPFAPPPVIGQSLKGIDAYDGIDSRARKAILETNAKSLLPRLGKA
jgi:predicted TIM-barrel fold metal-dependent hydrolase